MLVHLVPSAAEIHASLVRLQGGSFAYLTPAFALIGQVKQNMVALGLPDDDEHGVNHERFLVGPRADQIGPRPVVAVPAVADAIPSHVQSDTACADPPSSPMRMLEPVNCRLACGTHHLRGKLRSCTICGESFGRAVVETPGQRAIAWQMRPRPEGPAALEF